MVLPITGIHPFSSFSPSFLAIDFKWMILLICSRFRGLHIMTSVWGKLEGTKIYWWWRADPTNSQCWAGSHKNPGNQTGGEIEASRWVNSHILEPSRTYGVACEGFSGKTHALLMRLDERKSAMEKRGANRATSTPRHRRIGKNDVPIIQELIFFKMLSGTLFEALT